jgi:hypothetical protein
MIKYGASAEVVTDRGGEFGGEFQECLDAVLVDHRATSAYHPQANGLSERIVQVVKRALCKWCLGHPAGPGMECVRAVYTWVPMGYNFSTQAALRGFSPYQLLYGRAPVVPATIWVVVAEPLDLDDEARMAALVQEREWLFKRWMPMATLGNLQIAQHRDTLRYAHTRSGGSLRKPMVLQYALGDFVYLQREMVDTLDIRAGMRILRVKEVAPNGVLELEGSDLRTARVHMERCASCHRVDIGDRVDPRVAVPPANFACTRCRKASGAARMLLYDNCGAGWHLECLAAPFAAVPEGPSIVPEGPFCSVQGLN